MNDTHEDEDVSEGREKDTSPLGDHRGTGHQFQDTSALGLAMRLHQPPQLNPQALQRARQLLEDQPCFLPWTVVETH